MPGTSEVAFVSLTPNRESVAVGTGTSLSISSSVPPPPSDGWEDATAEGHQSDRHSLQLSPTRRDLNFVSPLSSGSASAQAVSTAREGGRRRGATLASFPSPIFCIPSSLALQSTSCPLDTLSPLRKGAHSEQSAQAIAGFVGVIDWSEVSGVCYWLCWLRSHLKQQPAGTAKVKRRLGVSL
jgi:hypothetical protein